MSDDSNEITRLTIDYADCHSKLRDAWERIRALREENEKLKKLVKKLEAPHTYESFGGL